MNEVDGWAADFHGRSKLFDAVAGPAANLPHARGFPSVDTLARLLADHGVRNAWGIPLVPCETGATERYGAAEYEADIARTGRLRVRPGSRHDLLNVLAWCAMPATKAALNRIHATDVASDAAGHRSRRRDAATLLDENGALIAVADDALAAHLRAMRWNDLFLAHRASLARAMRVFVLGHGLLDKAWSPYPGLTAHALTVAVEPDLIALPATELLARVDERVGVQLTNTGPDFAPRDLCPFPILGMPGFWAANEDPEFYRNTDYFRTSRRSM